ncbi:hypothetical protein JMK10_20750 [Rhodovulum sulfidophilum]|uniref:hypothetical protein n=1 Tax=Rhodovulum sulfidophilum TaxID=35806 RepID=UPI0019242146|nr:hypothetical protein [Rhodovulum sulfidophilum]MBL3575841.1 hypothetical protein [Rhodovulum sulfidophilum]MCF4119111.1 hypothetical protein [Rhodovulum sulfidophilum]
MGKYFSVSFRLANYIDGLSQFDGKIFTYVQTERKHSGGIEFKQIDVTDRCKESLELTGQDVVSGHFMINAPQNADANFMNDVYWYVTRVKIAEGWTYEPTADIAIPMNYSDPIFDDNYSEDGLSGKNSIDILGGAMFPSDLFLLSVVVYLPLTIVGFFLILRRRSRNRREREAASKIGNTRQHRGGEHMLCDYAEWQSGVAGPQPLRKVAPRIAPILKSVTKDRVVLQAGYHVIIRRSAITFALVFTVYAMSKFAITDMVNYAKDRHFFIDYVQDSDGHDRSVFIEHKPSMWNYLLTKINRIEIAYRPKNVENAGGYISKTGDLIGREFPPIAFFGSFLAFLVMLLFKSPAPIVVDRKRRLVYTWHRGRIWAARWDDVAITRVEGHLRHTALAFALHDTKGKGGTRWFILSGAPAWGEKDDPRDRLLSDARDFNRWQGMRLWLHEWVEGRREPSQEDLSRRFAVMHLLVPRQRKIPEVAMRQLDGK